MCPVLDSYKFGLGSSCNAYVILTLMDRIRALLML